MAWRLTPKNYTITDKISDKKPRQPKGDDGVLGYNMMASPYYGGLIALDLIGSATGQIVETG